MRIAVDAREIEGRPTGVGRYLEHLLRNLLALDESLQIVLYTRRGLPAPPPRTVVRSIAAPTGTAWLAMLPFWLHRDGSDLFFGPGYVLPLTRRPCVVTLHDLSFEVIPETFPWRERLRRRTLARLAAARAAAILCESSAVAGEIRARYQPSAPVEVVPLGVAPLFGQPPDPERLAVMRRDLGVEPPVLAYAGSLFNRRHPEALLEAAARVIEARGGGTLLVIGEDRTHPRIPLRRLAGELRIASRVRFLSYLPDPDVRAALAMSDLFLWPSDYEGFGLPPLEAMAAGVPVVSSRAPTLLETLDGAAMLTDEPTGESLAAACLAILADDALRRGLSEAGKRRAELFTWEACARATLGIFQRVVVEP